MQTEAKQQVGAVQKNSDGHLGLICNWCGGYGYLNNVTGGSSGCTRCDQTGVALPSILDLQRQIEELKQSK